MKEKRSSWLFDLEQRGAGCLPVTKGAAHMMLSEAEADTSSLGLPAVDGLLQGEVESRGSELRHSSSESWRYLEALGIRREAPPGGRQHRER